MQDDYENEAASSQTETNRSGERPRFRPQADDKTEPSPSPRGGLSNPSDRSSAPRGGLSNLNDRSSAPRGPLSSPLPSLSTSRSRRRRPVDRILPILLPLLLLLVGAGVGLGIGYRIWGYEAPYTVDLKAIKTPDWIEQRLIRKNIFSRPDVSMKQVNNIVIHYIGNPNTTADANQRYFDSLADQDPQQAGTSSSCHFIVGLDGEILQCIPIREIAYANAPRNFDTVSIEVCHPDETGEFTDESYASLVKLTAWLCGELKLDQNDVIRHYDVSGKGCPKYFVDNEDAWKQFRKDVKEAIRNQ